MTSSEKIHQGEEPVNDLTTSIIDSLLDIGAIRAKGTELTANFHAHFEPGKSGALTRDHLVVMAETLALRAQESGLGPDAVAALPGASEPLARYFVLYMRERPLPLIPLHMVGMDDTWRLHASSIPALPKKHPEVLLIGDCARSGRTLCEGAHAFETLEHEVTDVLVFLDFEQEAADVLEKQGVRLHAVVKKSEVLSLAHGRQMPAEHAA